MKDFGRPIVRIVLHCTASSLSATPEAILHYWRTALGWRNPGYHYLIDSQGRRHIIAHLSQTVNGVRGHNWNSCHVATIGGKHKDDRTNAQKAELVRLINELRGDDILGPVPVVGHRDLSPDLDGNGIITPDEWVKKCPHYNVEDWLRGVGIQ